MAILPNTTTTVQGHEKRMPVTTFLRDNLFTTPETLLTEDVNVDYRKGGQKVAPFVAGSVGGLNSQRAGYKTSNYTTPRIAPQRPLSLDVLKLRQLGENVHSQKTPEERARDILAKDINEMDDEISRREEVMSAQLLTTGIVQVRGFVDEQKTVYVDDNIDYNYTNNIILSGENKWDVATSQKYDDLGKMCETVMKAGYNPRYAILGKKASDLLIKDEKFQKLLDINHLALASIAPQLNIASGQGVAHIGRINALGIDVYTYLAWYLNDAGVLTPYIPENKVVVAPDAIGKFVYGLVTQVEEADREFHSYEGSRVPKEWTDVNGDTKMCRITSRPMPIPYDIDAWASSTVF